MICRRISKFFALVIVLTLSACSGNKVFEKWTDIEDYVWKREQKVGFDVVIEDHAPSYDVFLAIRHTSYYVFANLLVNVTVTYPSGETRTKDYDFFIRSKDGQFLGDGAGDLYDIELPIAEDMQFPDKGTYHYDIQNIMPYVETNDIMQVGLIVKKVKK